MTSVGKVRVAMGCENEACKLELVGHMIAGSYTMLRKEAQMEFFFLSSGYSCSICSYTRTSNQHTHNSHYPCINKPIATLRSEDRVLLEITEIHRFRRRQACHDPIVASRVRGTVYIWVLHSTHLGATPALRSPGIERWRADSPLRVLPLSHCLVRP